MRQAFGGFFQGKTVLVTGHTGFKGSWLSLWLQELGANVIGYSLSIPTQPNLFSISNVAEGMIDIRGDILDYDALKSVFDKYQPEIVFHLAAQSIVLHSLSFPKETFDVNVGGTVNVLEAIRCSLSVKAAVIVTSDKCYENKEWIWGYRENDPLGGKDPYSGSKSMAEVAIASYRFSFSQELHFPAIASVRAGNVIGGGDFSDLRIIPDCMRALMEGVPVPVRSPKSIRPWIHLLDPLRGYLLLALRLFHDGARFAEAWNFGPYEQEAVDVQAIVEKAIDFWGSGDWLDTGAADRKQETGLLRLNWDKSANYLGWHPIYPWFEAIERTVDWFICYDKSRKISSSIDMRSVCLNQLYAYAEEAGLTQSLQKAPS